MMSTSEAPKTPRLRRCPKCPHRLSDLWRHTGSLSSFLSKDQVIIEGDGDLVADFTPATAETVKPAEDNKAADSGKRSTMSKDSPMEMKPSNVKCRGCSASCGRPALEPSELGEAQRSESCSGCFATAVVS